MSLETQQVNIQDLARLNDALVLCLDAVRRVVPQIAQTQSSAWQQLAWTHPLFTQPHTLPIAPYIPSSPFTPFVQSAPFMTTPYGYPPSLDPLSSIYLRSTMTMNGATPSWIPGASSPFVNLGQRAY